MKKVLVVLLVLVLLAGAAAGGYFWYRETHIFLGEELYGENVYEKDALELDLTGRDITLDYYNRLQAQLPDCRITWEVPFQGGRVSNRVTTLTVDSMTEADMDLLPYFPELKSINAMAMNDYNMLEELCYFRPDLEIAYQVDLGGTAVAPDTTALTLEEGKYDYYTMMNNLVHLPKVESITLPCTMLEKASLEEFQMMYPGIRLDYTVVFRGQEADPALSEMDLSDLTGEEVAQVARELEKFPDLTSVELMNAEGKSNLSLTDVQTLQEAAPNATFHYTFTFYKQTLSTTDTEVEYKNIYMKDSDETQIRQILDVMDSCKRFVFNNCHISNEVMASIREDYRDRTKIVWRVYFGKNSSCLTDKEVIKVVGGLKDSNCQSLKYCEDVRFIDFGHNDYLTDISYIKYMTKLEAIILSGSSIKDLTPFENHPSIYFLEISNCSYIEDLTPLAGCKKLGMLNISYTKVESVQPIMELKLDRLKYVRCKLNEEEVAAYMELHPESWVSNTGHEYGVGWRYEEDGSRSDYYAMLAGPDVFNYDGVTHDTYW